MTCQNPVLDLDVIIGRMTHEQYLKINVPVSWDEIHGLQNNILSWRKQSQQFGTLVERFITYAGTLRHIHLNAPGAPITDTGVQPAARGVRVTVTKDDKPDDIYRNPDRYSVHTQRRFGLLPNQREKQPVKATG
ncbi:hypothetical protein PITCH_A220039 [uncultured Desulfobacterium sp.]|uniref:Uncharacterized protein n=1 Tax=uncultured Desulfobacterium sp. TaxID=201089 RepID=A0A445MY19_9BACT|nr:hypothetical protein PITCH_A220039 [uncultured Desulfobacterium sp.]